MTRQRRVIPTSAASHIEREARRLAPLIEDEIEIVKTPQRAGIVMPPLGWWLVRYRGTTWWIEVAMPHPAVSDASRRERVKEAAAFGLTILDLQAATPPSH